MKNYILFIFGLLALGSCKTSKVSKFLHHQKLDAHTGVVIKDTKTGKILFEENADLTFVPASNTKILSLYASLKTLGDSISTFKYFNRNDTLFVLGLGDPSFLHPDFPENKALNIFKNAKAIVISDQNWQQNALGYGWAWDDYNDYYQPEISSFPLYGNVVRAKKTNEGLGLSPSFFENLKVESKFAGRNVVRDLRENSFSVNSMAERNANFSQEIPFITHFELSARLLSEALNKPVEYRKFEITEPLKTVKGMAADTVMRKMMQISDNFLAEQLLLLAGGTLNDTLSTAKSIKSVKPLISSETHLNWVDGSGLSRYNLFTPRFFVETLDQMYEEYGQEKLFSYMSIGGKAGTLRNKYKKSNVPYVFAKTGSMSGVYNESGFIVTKSGRMLTYSVMKNNFVGSVSENGKRTMEFMEWIRERY